MEKAVWPSKISLQQVIQISYLVSIHSSLEKYVLVATEGARTPKFHTPKKSKDCPTKKNWPPRKPV